MGHAISAVILLGSFDLDRASHFDLRPIKCNDSLTIFPVNADYCDYWSKKLGQTDFLSKRPLLDCTVLHHMMCEIAETPTFAIIETDYFGGNGDQAAVVYRGSEQIMKPQEGRRGPINNALKLLGVRSNLFIDAFTKVGLNQYRHWDGIFMEYDVK